MSDHEYYLRISGQEDSPMILSAFKHLETFNIWSHCRVVNYQEYLELIEQGKIAKAESYWQIKNGQIGLINESYYNQYSVDWNNLTTCFSDFCSGWRACEKQ